MRLVRFALFAAAAAAGCSSDRRCGIEGAVTYDGKPVGVGTIAFLPEFDGGVKCGGRVADGRYQVEPKFGPLPGKYKVEIRWAKPTGKRYKNEFGDEFDRAQEGLPDKYHANTTLTAEVKPGPNVIDFNLEK